MMKYLLMLLLLNPLSSFARGHSSNYCSSCERTPSGHIKRSQDAKSEFKQSNPCPSTGATSGGCNGYVIDHKEPLKRGGADSPSNMQWQTIEDSKAKDAWE